MADTADTEWLHREIKAAVDSRKGTVREMPADCMNWDSATFIKFRLDELRQYHAAQATRTRGVSDAESLRQLGAFLAEKVPRLQSSDSLGIPARYAGVNIARLNGPALPLYDYATKSLLALHGCPAEGNGNWTSHPHSPGGIIALIGKRGTGKTHMACGLLNLFNVMSRDNRGAANGTAHYRRAADVFGSIKSTFNGGRGSETQRDIVQGLRDASLLVIDEIKFDKQSSFDGEILFGLIDGRYANLLPTILISNSSHEGFRHGVGDSISSRIGEVGEIIETNWPSFRAGIAKARCATMPATA